MSPATTMAILTVEPRHQRLRFTSDASNATTVAEIDPPIGCPWLMLAAECTSDAVNGLGTPGGDARGNRPPLRARADPRTSTFEPAAQSLASSEQPALNRPDRAVQHAGGLLVGVSFKIAEHDGRSERLGQPIELLVQFRPLLRRRYRCRLSPS